MPQDPYAAFAAPAPADPYAAFQSPSAQRSQKRKSLLDNTLVDAGEIGAPAPEDPSYARFKENHPVLSSILRGVSTMGMPSPAPMELVGSGASPAMALLGAVGSRVGESTPVKFLKDIGTKYKNLTTPEASGVPKVEPFQLTPSGNMPVPPAPPGPPAPVGFEEAMRLGQRPLFALDDLIDPVTPPHSPTFIPGQPSLAPRSPLGRLTPQDLLELYGPAPKPFTLSAPGQLPHSTQSPLLDLGPKDLGWSGFEPEQFIPPKGPIGGVKLASPIPSSPTTPAIKGEQLSMLTPGQSQLPSITKFELNRMAHARAQELSFPGSPAGKNGHPILSSIAKQHYGVGSWNDLSVDQMRAVHDFLDTQRRLPSLGELK